MMMLVYFTAFIFWFFVFAKATNNSDIVNHQVSNKPCFEENRNILTISKALGWSKTSEELICQNKSNWIHGCCNKSKVLRFNISESCVNFNSFLDSFRNKKICFLGDSLSQNTYKALLSQLTQFNYQFESRIGPAKHWASLIGYNLTFYFHEFYYMNLKNETHGYNYTRNPTAVFIEQSSIFISDV